MKRPSTLNERPPFLKGLSMLEVGLFCATASIVGVILGVLLAIFVTHSLLPVFTGLALGATSIFLLPKALAQPLINLRAGKPAGYLYRRVDAWFYGARYISAPGIYQGKRSHIKD